MCMILKCITNTICGLTDRQWRLFTKVNTIHQNVTNFDVPRKTK